MLPGNGSGGVTIDRRGVLHVDIEGVRILRTAVDAGAFRFWVGEKGKQLDLL